MAGTLGLAGNGSAVGALYFPAPLTGSFGNCSEQASPDPFSDCDGAMLEACLVRQLCSNQSCPLSLFKLLQLYEAPYPEGPGSFERCGGTADSCMAMADIPAGARTQVLACYSDKQGAGLQAMRSFEPRANQILQGGTGFPHVTLDGQYLDAPSDYLSAVCKQEPWLAFCQRSQIQIGLGLEWSISRIDQNGTRNLEVAIRFSLDQGGTANLTAGSPQDDPIGVVNRLDMAPPTAPRPGRVEVRVMASTIRAYLPAMMSALSSPLFSPSMATQLNKTAAFRGISAQDITSWVIQD
eukprot:TRINITY_DN27797_c0_g1_i2.p1 TRINITY_DN27797_c0_g1~~TRINITY_DN27797_c0_g1_i2.p1  ORF type:complete len:295 (-),score=59.57 TRINITY_DN27797_c0_g1_i2:498-1382(-)